MRLILTKRFAVAILAIGTLTVGALAVGPRLVRRASQPYQGAGTKRMAERLRLIANDAILNNIVFLNDERLDLFQRRLALVDSPSVEVPLRFELAQELLRAGKTESAIENFQSLHALLRPFPDANADALTSLEDWLAISYMRLGEQQNCIFHHGPDSCLFPIQGGGVHTFEDGSRAAVAAYEKLLEKHPDRLEYRWLLNIAHMTLGEYPDQVPPQWLIPQEVFASDYDIQRFYDIAPQLGLDVVGLAGGSVMEDFDGDGYLDIMCSSYGLRDQLRFFRSGADGTFVDRTVEAGLEGIVGGLNLTHADYNNDGSPDVLVLRGGWFGRAGEMPNSLLKNNGDGTFDDMTEEAGLLSFHPTQTACWGDYNNDGWLDLFIGNESVDQQTNPCELYHNNGDGTFTECASLQGVAIFGYVKGVVWGDYNNDGLPDLYVSRWTEPNLLLRNDGPLPGETAAASTAGASTLRRWQFTDVTHEAGVAEPIASFPCWFWDYDNDGWLDLFVAGWPTFGDVIAHALGEPHQGSLPKLYRNNRDGTFADVTRSANVETPLLAMGSNFGDLDNDGWLDFYVGTGEPDLRALIPNRMFRGRGGEQFQDVTTSGGFGHLQKGHGVAFGDLDNDGDQDIYAVIGGSFAGDTFQNVLFHNPGHGNHWITLGLEGVQSNRLALGARIRVRVRTDDGIRDIYATVTSGGSFGSSSLQQEIGLGDAKAIEEIEITWPASGTVQVFRDVAMDQILRIREGDSTPNPVVLKRLDFTASKPATGGGHQHHHRHGN